MRKLFYLVVSIVIFGLIISGCIFHVVPPLGQDGSIDIVKNDVFFEIDLIAGQHTVAGSITVSNDDENLLVTYETVDNWLINETHLYVDTIIPTKSEPGKFPYKHEELGGVITDTYKIPLDDLGVVPCDIVYIAAHADLVEGETEETGWAEGVKIEPRKNWSMYFNYQIWPCGSEIPELTEAISQEIDLSIGGTVEVTDPENIIYGVKLIIPPMPSKKDRKKLIANIAISYIDDPYSLELPDNRGFLLPPVVINSDILFDTECILEIPYTEDNLSNMGFSSNEDVKIYYYNYYSSSWEEVPINKRNNRAEIDFDYMREFTITIDDINETYACSTPSFILPSQIDQGYPQPGDLLYKLSFYGISEGWIPGHVGIYVGEHEKDSEGNPYNVIEALFSGGVQRNYYNPIGEFSGDATYMGARQPCDFGPLNSMQRKYIVDYVESLVGLPYASVQTTVGALYGMARGELVKGDYGTFNCVGLAEAAYELPSINGGLGLVSDKDEGNDCISIYHYTLASCALTPADQYDKTEAAEGYTVSGKVADSQGNGIPGVTLNLKLVAHNNNYSDSFSVNTNANGDWDCGRQLGREWNITPQKEGYTFEPSTIKVTGDANNIDFIGTFMTGYRYPIQWSTAESNGWMNPLGEGQALITSTSYDYNSPIYLNNWGKRHVGIDIVSEEEENAEVYAIADGTVDYVFTQDSWYDKHGILRNHSVIIIKHTNSNNEDFFAIYGHVFAKDNLESTVKADEKIGVVKKSGSPCHLHFGINLSSKRSDFIFKNSDGDEWTWGRIPAFADPADCVWVDPIDYLNTHSVGNIVSGPVHNLTKGTYYDTIQAALNDADSDNTIEVVDGTYDESITFLSGKVILLQSVNGASSTTIRGNDGSPTVTLNNSLESITLEGFTITHESGIKGSGIFIYNGNLTIKNCTISGNTGFHGGIRNVGTLNITGSTISGNTASKGGGIINSGTLNITVSTISGNTASSDGGGIINSGTLNITGSTISGNTATRTGGGIANWGTLTITESTISGNTAGGAGGIANFYDTINNHSCPLTIIGSTISGNTSIHESPGIDICYSIEDITIGGSSETEKNIICGNYKIGESPSLDQQIKGGSDERESLYETYKDTNYISAYCGVPSGSVHNLTKNTYYNTIQAALNDAASDNIIEVSDGIYDESTIFPSGKKIILQSINGTSSTTIRGDNGSPTATFNGSLEGTTLDGFTITHASGNEGEGIYNRGNLNIKNCVISGNSTHDSLGGGIYNGGSMTISGSTISDNSASRRYFYYEWGGGGGISNSGNLTITESTISGNSSNVGGGMYNYGTLIITSSIISGNSGGSGGGISNSGNLTITESTISDNSADNSGGGGIFNFSDNSDNSTVTISGCTISGNSSQFGGGISNHEHATLTITESTISGNSATNNSGGICVAGIGNLTISGCTISGNSSQFGGGMYIFPLITIAIGGDIASDKNTICGNYKIGESPSLDQQIRGTSGSLYETYKETNYISAYCE